MTDNSFQKVWCVFVLFLIAYTPMSSQLMEVTGTVISELESEPLIGVNILVKGTEKGTITDVDGTFSLEAEADAILVFSYVGYQTQEIPVEGRPTLEVVLRSDAQVLENIVVTGYRTEIKSNISSAITSVKAKNIEKLPVIGFDQALQGQVAGLQVTQTTGAPGDNIAVRIRGAGTLGNNNPLYIIDGVPTTGNINMFSTADIESIEVLKDGAAASIYGARAANGVIIITTKKGTTGAPKFSFQSYYGLQEAYTLPELLNAEEYLMIRNEAIMNANTLRDPIRQLETYDPAILDTLPDIDWLDEVFRVAPMQRYTLTASGGGDYSNFYVLGEYFNQEGVFKGQGFEKYLLRFNGEIGGKRLKIGNNLSFSYSERAVIGSSGDGAGPGNELSGIRYSLIAAPLFPKTYPDGSLIPTTAFLNEPILFGDGNANPVAFIEATDWNIDRYRVFGNVFAQLNLMDGLNLRTNLGIDLLFRSERIFKERLSAAIYDPTSLSEGRSTDRNLVWNNTLDYAATFGPDNDHRITALIGMEAITNRTEYLGASARNFFSTNPLFRYVDNSIAEEIDDVDASGIATEWSLLSYFAQGGYSYQNRYVINASIRRDGSSRFGEGNRWGTFPSVSLAWNISNEPFFRDVPLISQLRIRGSWGQLGNQEIGIYPFASLVETGIRVYPFGDQIVTGAEVRETGNSNIKWETTTQTNFGLELSLFEDALSIIADYYVKNSEDILVRVPLPQSAGAFNPPFVNAGAVRNRGFEGAVIWKNAIGAFRYELGLNFSTVENEVISLADSEPLLGGFGLSDGPITRTEPGYPIGSFYLYQMEGLFQTQEEIDAAPFQTNDTRPGDIRFADLNGDNVIDDEDRAHLGSPFPDLVFGLNGSVRFRNFDLSFLLQGVQGNDVYFLYGDFAYEAQLRGFNAYAEILNRWTPENPNTDIPKVSVDDRNDNRRISTRFLEDGSYLRMRNITLGYDFSSLINKDWLPGLRAYVSVQNAFTITNYPGLDPEIQANTNDTQGFNISSDLAVGIDWGTVPAPRIVLFGLNVDF